MLAATPALQIKPTSPLPAARPDAPLGGFERVLDARIESAKSAGVKTSSASPAETAPTNAQRSASEAQQPRDEAVEGDDETAIESAPEQSPDAGDTPDATDTNADASAGLAVNATIPALPASQASPTDSAVRSTAPTLTAESAAAQNQLIPSASASSASPDTHGEPIAESSVTTASQQPNQASAEAINPDANASKQVVTPGSAERPDQAKSDQSKPAERSATSSASASDAIEADTPRAAPIDPTTGAGADGRHGSGDSRASREFVQDIVRAAANPGVNAASRGAESADESVAFRAQVSRGLEAALRQDGGAVTLRLKPDSLGALRIDLQIHAGEVAASFRSSSREAHDLLNSQLPSLRASLEAKGLSVRAMEVQPPPASSGAQNDTGASRDPGAQQGAGHTGSDDSPGSNTGGHASSGREDPAGSMNTHRPVALAEAEPTSPGWIRVGLPGALDAVA